MDRVDVIELFAGVGGFRIGLDRVGHDFFRTVWSNQYEPSTKAQHASETYVARFGAENHVNKDIAEVTANEIPDHDMLVGGFPCQDYSVARTLSRAAGIEGKKGVLWWEIHRILREKGCRRPSILFLENVDRLIQSPATQRGRDFAVILQSLADLGYIAEWRIVNAADYGMPQRRKRTYILAYRKNSSIANSIIEADDWIFSDGVFAKAFPVRGYSGQELPCGVSIKSSGKDIADVSDLFNKSNKGRPFENSGVMIDGMYWTCRTEPLYDGECVRLGDVLVSGADRELLTEEFFIPEDELPKWKYLKGAKREERKTKEGFVFSYSEGAMTFPDALDKPSRTIITSEGGAAPSRFKHVIVDPATLRYRRLLPVELERLNMFPDNHTAGQTDTKRAFFMGNALVCGIVTKVGEELYRRLKD